MLRIGFTTLMNEQVLVNLLITRLMGRRMLITSMSWRVTRTKESGSRRLSRGRDMSSFDYW